MSYQGILEVKVVEGRNLKNQDLFGKMDPYVILRIGNETKKSVAIKNGGCNPVIDQTFNFNIIPGTSYLELEAYDKDFMRDDFIGFGRLPLDEVFRVGQSDSRIEIKTKDGYFAGQFRLEITCKNRVPQQQPLQAPIIQQPLQAPIIQQPLQAPIIQPPLQASNTQQQLQASNIQQPLQASNIIIPQILNQPTATVPPSQSLPQQSVLVQGSQQAAPQPALPSPIAQPAPVMAQPNPTPHPSNNSNPLPPSYSPDAPSAPIMGQSIKDVHLHNPSNELQPYPQSLSPQPSLAPSMGISPSSSSHSIQQMDLRTPSPHQPAMTQNNNPYATPQYNNQAPNAYSANYSYGNNGFTQYSAANPQSAYNSTPPQVGVAPPYPPYHPNTAYPASQNPGVTYPPPPPASAYNPYPAPTGPYNPYPPPQQQGYPNQHQQHQPQPQPAVYNPYPNSNSAYQPTYNPYP